MAVPSSDSFEESLGKGAMNGITSRSPDFYVCVWLKSVEKLTSNLFASAVSFFNLYEMYSTTYTNLTIQILSYVLQKYPTNISDYFCF